MTRTPEQTADDRATDYPEWLDFCAKADLLWPFAVRVAATLRIADHVAAGPVGVAQLADATHTDADALSRLLRYLVSRGLFAEPTPGTFALNETARPLLADGPRAWLDLNGANGKLEQSFAGLLDVVRTGEAGYPKQAGRSFWAQADDDPVAAGQFDATMAAHSAWFADGFVSSYDFASARVVADIGGGTGTLLSAVLRANEHLDGILVDLPGTVAAAGPTVREAGLADRITLAPGSFFDPLPTGADVYLLANVLHDWGDRPAAEILGRCAEAAGHDGRVVVVDRVTDGLDPHHIAAYDLRMLAAFGGRERSLAQFRDLVVAAGLTVLRGRRMRTGISWLECVPAGAR